MDRIFIKPAEGLRVKDPNTKEPLPKEGKQVQKSIYWLRRINAGDVLLVEAPKPSKHTSKINPIDKEGAK